MSDSQGTVLPMASNSCRCRRPRRHLPSPSKGTRLGRRAVTSSHLMRRTLTGLVGFARTVDIRKRSVNVPDAMSMFAANAYVPPRRRTETFACHDGLRRNRYNSRAYRIVQDASQSHVRELMGPVSSIPFIDENTPATEATFYHPTWRGPRFTAAPSLLAGVSLISRVWARVCR